MKKKLNVGIGFVTGRKSFKRVVKTYIDNWNESNILNAEQFSLHLFVAYDLAYTDTKLKDYQISDEEILDTIDSAHYIGKNMIEFEAQCLVDKKVLTSIEANLIFGEGYARKRNVVLYFALKNRMDYLIFLDDEYPIATININNCLVWKGQEVLSTHINNLMHADMTHGHHCGYISPIPNLSFDHSLTENDFRLYIESISNELINWDSVKEKMNNGGVTFADLNVINNKKIDFIREKNGMKFISGANLGFNLGNIDKLFPFYNPPGARGEDAFLSTCLGNCSVRKVPCYTFHDGFGVYEHLLLGVLPNALKVVNPDQVMATKRFLQASIGWIRYKPLLLYITDRTHFKEKVELVLKNLKQVVPKICHYFEEDGFESIISEFAFFSQNVELHYEDFMNTREAWKKVVYSTLKK